MGQNKKLNQAITHLSDLKTPENWMEITGPFYHIKTEHKETMGPFHSHDIASLLEVTTLSDATLIKDAKNTVEWIPLYSHPAFQRRKPSIVTEISNIKASTFYYLKNGSPIGPVKPSDMEELIKNKDIISTDAVSIDEGKSWLKLYQVPGFDQRSYTASELPIIPEKSEDDEPSSFNEDNESTQIANLVYIESRKSKEQEVTVNIKSEEETNTSKKGLFLIVGIIILGIIALLSKSNVSEPSKTTKKATKTARSKTVDKEEKTRAPAKAKAKISSPKPRNRVESAPTREARPKSRTPKSFTSTPIYKDRKKMKDNALEEESYYDDGEGDIENDAVRKAVSKETLYPEDSEVLEPEQMEEDIYKDEIDDLSSEENEISSAEEVWGDEVKGKKGASKDPFEDEAY